MLYLSLGRVKESRCEIRNFHVVVMQRGHCMDEEMYEMFSLPSPSSLSFLRGCLHDTGATFALKRVHSGSLSWLYICLHDTTAKCHAGASHASVSSPRFLYRGENFTLVRNLATVSCKLQTTTRFGVKSVCR